MATVEHMDRSGGRPVDRLWVLLIAGRRLMGVWASALLLASCGADQDPTRQGDGWATDRVPERGGVPSLVIDFEAGAATGAPITGIDASVGRARASAVSLGGGQILTAVGADGGAAARFPSNTESAVGVRAVFRVGLSDSAALSPGRGGFQFGVDLMYPDGVAWDSAGDDGDNVFQRGLFGDRGQFKLQVDQGRPACRIAGGERETLVTAEATLAPDQWYRLLCQRSDDEVTIFVAELGSPWERLSWTSWSVSDRAGAIPPSQESVPVSIGGKLNRQGEIVRDAPDQFSGVLDNVVFRSLKER